MELLILGGVYVWYNGTWMQNHLSNPLESERNVNQK